MFFSYHFIATYNMSVNTSCYLMLLTFLSSIVWITKFCIYHCRKDLNLRVHNSYGQLASNTHSLAITNFLKQVYPKTGDMELFTAGMILNYILVLIISLYNDCTLSANKELV